jgi:hypothetical protein
MGPFALKGGESERKGGGVRHNGPEGQSSVTRDPGRLRISPARPPDNCADSGRCFIVYSRCAAWNYLPNVGPIVVWPPSSMGVNTAIPASEAQLWYS